MAKEYGLDNGSKPKKSKRVLFFLLGSFLMVVLGFWAATQYVAVQAHYHSQLGLPLFLGLYAPWQILFWQPYLSPILLAKAKSIGILTFAIPIITFLVIAIKLRKPSSIKDLHGSARWATLEEINKFGLLDGHGVYVGGFHDEARDMTIYLRHNGPEHILCFAPTRSGKGIGLIIPTLLAWLESTFVLDIKGENYALTSGYLKSLGHTILYFDPSDTTGKTARFNPLEEVRLDSPKATSDVQNIAMMIVDPEGKGLGDHWAKTGFAFMSGALMHTMVKILHDEKRSASLNDLCMAMANEEQTSIEFFQEMLETDHVSMMKSLFNTPDDEAMAIHKFVASSAREMLNKAEGEQSGVVATANSNLSLYRDHTVAKNTAHSDFKLHDLMNSEKPVNLYIVLSPADIDRLRPLTRLIITLLLTRATEKMDFEGGRSVAKYKHRLLMMLDELPALKKLEAIEKAIAFCAGYGIKLYIIVQDVTQLNAAYGKDNALMGNCHIRIAYAPNTIETAKILSEMSGKTTIVHEKVSLSGKQSSSKKSSSLSVQETQRPLLTPDECMRLPAPEKNSKGEVTKAGQMLIFVAGQNPILGRQILYFKDPIFMARAKISPPEKSDRIWLLDGTRADTKAPNPVEVQPKVEEVVKAEHADFTEFLN